MKKTESLRKFEEALVSDPELRNKLDLAVKEAMESGDCKTDGEALSKAAASLGYEISFAELERMEAENEELDLDELEQVSGGESYCSFFWHTAMEDEYGHNAWCLTLWHCDMVSMHTETESKNVHCWENFQCSSSTYCNVENSPYQH